MGLEKNGNVQVGQVRSFSNGLGTMLSLFSHLALPAMGLNKYPTVWLDGAIPAHYLSIIKLNEFNNI